MYDQPRYEPLAESNFFADRLSARPHVEGTIARGEQRDDEPLYTGKEAGVPLSQIPQLPIKRCTIASNDGSISRLRQIEPVELRLRPADARP